MTKKKAVENHRKMWRWIAEKTLERKRKVWKYEYFKENKLDPPINYCFCCGYTSQFTGDWGDCVKCPINWDNTYCLDSYYLDWSEWEGSYRGCAYYANAIANLPERETRDFDIVEECVL